MREHPVSRLVSLSTTAVLALIVGCCPQSTCTTTAGREFSVQGMSCDGCVQTVTAALTKIPGVQSAKVSLEEKKAVVVADPAQVPSEKIVAAVKQAGYQAEPIAAATPPAGAGR